MNREYEQVLCSLCIFVNGIGQRYNDLELHDSKSLLNSSMYEPVSRQSGKSRIIVELLPIGTAKLLKDGMGMVCRLKSDNLEFFIVTGASSITKMVLFKKRISACECL